MKRSQMNERWRDSTEMSSLVIFSVKTSPLDTAVDPGPGNLFQMYLLKSKYNLIEIPT